MSEQQEEEAPAEIAESLRRRAVDLWGPDRAEALTSVIEETAQRIFRISRDPPAADEEPRFYM